MINDLFSWSYDIEGHIVASVGNLKIGNTVYFVNDTAALPYVILGYNLLPGGGVTFRAGNGAGGYVIAYGFELTKERPLIID